METQRKSNGSHPFGGTKIYGFSISLSLSTNNPKALVHTHTKFCQGYIKAQNETCCHINTPQPHCSKSDLSSSKTPECS